MSAVVVSACAAVIGAGTGIVSAINGNKAQQKALEAQDRQAKLELRTNADLQQMQMQMQSDDNRFKALLDSKSNMYSAILSASLNAQIVSKSASEDAEKKNLILISIGGGVVLLGAVVVFKIA